MTNVQQDREFISTLISSSLLEEAITWIGYHMEPTDVFSQKQLEAWARDAGYELSEEQ